MPISALTYHRRTSYDRHAMSGHGLEWAAQPDVFKTYAGLKTMPLPPVQDHPEEDLYAVVQKPAVGDFTGAMTLEMLARVVQLTHCVTARARHGGTYFYYRNVASAGALYPFELYVAARGLSGLDDGLCHHTLGLDGLTLLKTGDVMPQLADVLAPRQSMPIKLAFFLSSIFFRSSWKYRERGYRYNLLDTGHLAESLVLSLKAHGLPFQCHWDFNDEKMNSLLEVDPLLEACLMVLCISGKKDSLAEKTHRPMAAGPNLQQASQVSVRKTQYTLIRQIHAASSTVVKKGHAAKDMGRHLGVKIKRQWPVPAAGNWQGTMRYPQAVVQRRSKRNFIQAQLCAKDLAGLLELICASSNENQGEYMLPGQLISVGFLAGNVEGLDCGFYLLDLNARSVALVEKGAMMGEMAHICLGQAWLAHSAMHVVFLSNLEILERTWGPRGYRHAMLMAGRLGQRTYLGATALGLGCCGIGAFYDAEAARLLGLNDGSVLLYLVAVGPVKR